MILDVFVETAFRGWLMMRRKLCKKMAKHPAGRGNLQISQLKQPGLQNLQRRSAPVIEIVKLFRAGLISIFALHVKIIENFDGLVADQAITER